MGKLSILFKYMIVGIIWELGVEVESQGASSGSIDTINRYNGIQISQY